MQMKSCSQLRKKNRFLETQTSEESSSFSFCFFFFFFVISLCLSVWHSVNLFPVLAINKSYAHKPLCIYCCFFVKSNYEGIDRENKKHSFVQKFTRTQIVQALSPFERLIVRRIFEHLSWIVETAHSLIPCASFFYWSYLKSAKIYIHVQNYWYFFVCVLLFFALFGV